MQEHTTAFANVRCTRFARFLLVLGILAVCTQLSFAQRVYYGHRGDEPKFNFGGGFGFTVPTDRAGDLLNTGWNLNLRGGVNVNRNFAADLDFTYSRNRINDATLAAFGEPDGHVGTWSLTFNPVVKFVNTRHQRVVPYITAGFGLYSRNLTLTEPAPAFVCDPLFGCFPGTVNQTVASNTTYKGGWNAGGGFDIGPSRGLKFFMEARYHRMFTSHAEDFTLIPVTFGVRF